MASVRVTHSFHPLCGKSLEVVDRERSPSGDILFVRDERGRLRKLRAAWTSVAPVDAFVVVARGRAHFRPEDLDALAALIGALRAARGE